MERISGGEAIVRSLIDHDVDTVFGLPGVQTYAVFDALHCHSDNINSVFSRHEQGAGYMAFGYARSSGKPESTVSCPVPACSIRRQRCAPRGAATSRCSVSPAKCRRHSSANTAAIYTNSRPTRDHEVPL